MNVYVYFEAQITPTKSLPIATLIPLMEVKLFLLLFVPVKKSLDLFMGEEKNKK